jgi:hypothetical protein
MEPLTELDPAKEQLLISSIQQIIELENILIDLLQNAYKQTLANPGINSAWFADTAATIRKYRDGLQSAARSHDCATSKQPGCIRHRWSDVKIFRLRSATLSPRAGGRRNY